MFNKLILFNGSQEWQTIKMERSIAYAIRANPSH